MSKQQIKSLIAQRITTDGLLETGVTGVKLFRATTSIPCAPAVYEPSVIAIVSGNKEAVLDGARHVYDNSRYLCCPTSMPVKAGTPAASPDNPLYGVYIALDARLMGELAMEMDNAGGGLPIPDTAAHAQGIRFARWDNAQHLPLPLS